MDKDSATSSISAPQLMRLKMLCICTSTCRLPHFLLALYPNFLPRHPLHTPCSSREPRLTYFKLVTRTAKYMKGVQKSTENTLYHMELRKSASLISTYRIVRVSRMGNRYGVHFMWSL
jgi:hypothetical protein